MALPQELHKPKYINDPFRSGGLIVIRIAPAESRLLQPHFASTPTASSY